MGMGEPLMNYDNVLRAIRPDYSGRRPWPCRLPALPFPQPVFRTKSGNWQTMTYVLIWPFPYIPPVKRSGVSLWPVNRAHSLAELAESLKYFTGKTGIRPTFEYLLLAGINDSLEDAKVLAAYCRQFPVKINIIEYNAVENSPFRHSPAETTGHFYPFSRVL